MQHGRILSGVRYLPDTPRVNGTLPGPYGQLIESDFDYDFTRPGDWVLMVYEPDGFISRDTRPARIARIVGVERKTLLVLPIGFASGNSVLLVALLAKSRFC